jgi:membrane-bound lytic murein transglycosylase D
VVATEPLGAATESKKGVHFVLPGETLYSIGKLYLVAVDSLKTWNNLKTMTLQSGQQLRVAAVVPAAAPEGDGQFYVVQPGDTAFSIARKFGISLDELRLKNQLSDFQLQPGMRLRVR